MLFEIVAKEETENGCIALLKSGKMMQSISNVTKKLGFDCYVKGYPKDKVDYVPTNKKYSIKTVEDIAELSEQQFEFFVDDLRSYTGLMRQVKAVNKVVGSDVVGKVNDGFTWLDSGLNESKINFQVSNKI